MTSVGDTVMETIKRMMAKRDEQWGDIVASTLTADQLSRVYRRPNNYGMTHTDPFFVWTKHYVYFATQPDMHWEEIKCVPRNPTAERRVRYV